MKNRILAGFLAVLLMAVCVHAAARADDQNRFHLFKIRASLSERPLLIIPKSP